jgi:hypothetical protein
MNYCWALDMVVKEKGEELFYFFELAACKSII